MTERPQKKPKEKKAPRKATPKSLENAGLYYLRRFASSSANFRRVLMRRVERSARFHGTDAEEGARIIEDIISRFTKNGFLDDNAYARGVAASQHRRGASARAIGAKLIQKGLDAGIIEEALESLGGESEEPELAAAVTLAKRRRLGPFNRKGGRGEARDKDMRDKDLVALARAGFSYGMALKVVDAETARELEEEVDALRI